MTRLLPLLLLAAAVARAHDPITTKLSFSTEIVRLFHRHCAACHREGGAAPFALTNYAEARPWAVAIKEEVLARRMPPWGAVKGFGEFKNEEGLSQEELHMIADWVEGGAPEGDPAFLPQDPKTAAAAVAEEPSGNGVAGRGPVLTGRLRLGRPLMLHGLRPQTPPPDNAKLIARLPSGEIIPIVWFYGMTAKFLHPFWLRAPRPLPAGAELILSGGVSVQLYTRPR
ncbi:MAG: cytochrome c [Bryobacterales bacterium]|nr:cytochrome c [Bryobacterales bacterium]